jgi:hypothetical protein
MPVGIFIQIKQVELVIVGIVVRHGIAHKPLLGSVEPLIGPASCPEIHAVELSTGSISMGLSSPVELSSPFLQLVNKLSKNTVGSKYIFGLMI